MLNILSQDANSSVKTVPIVKTCGYVDIIVKDSMPDFSHTLPDITVTDVLIFDIGHPESRLTIISIYGPLV